MTKSAAPVILKFRIESLDAQVSTLQLARNIIKASPAFGKRVKIPTVKVKRGESLPSLPEIQSLLMQVDWASVGQAVLETAGKAGIGWLVKEYLDWVKEAYPTASVESEEQSEPPTPTPAKAKKKAAKSNRASTVKKTAKPRKN
jgi:hypothetical protein